MELPKSDRRHEQLFVFVVFGLLVLCGDVGAGAAQDDLKAGAKLEKQRRFFSAAEAYSRALRQKPRDQKARQALERTADRAIEEQLQYVEALDAELRLDEAIAELDVTARFRERLAELGVEPRQTHAIAARRDDLVSRRVQALLAEAESARAVGLWSAAIAHLQQVDALRPRAVRPCAGRRPPLGTLPCRVQTPPTRLGWRVTVTDQSATGMSLPLPVRARAQATGLWQSSPVSTVTRENAYTGQRDTVVMVGVAGRGKAQADHARERARVDLLQKLIQAFATEATQRLLSIVDVEPAVADPSELAPT